MKSNILDLLPGVRTNIPLAPYTSFRIGGKASYFFIAKTKEAVQKAVSAARTADLPFFILGGGTNILVADKGYKGLVIKIENRKLNIKNSRVYAQAGVSFSELVNVTARKGLAGFEWAGGLPGTVGGAVRGNAGAFGGEVKDALVEVEVLDEKGSVQKFTNKNCAFGYRSSVFKKKNLIVLSATFALRKGNTKRIQKIIKEHIRYRRERHPLEYPNAGSVFANCDVRNVPAKMRSAVQHVVKRDPFPVVPAAYLISEAKLKGIRIGKAEISKKHPNYIVNRGKAKSRDVLLLIEKAKRKVRRKFSVNLQEEIQLVQ